MNVVKESEGNLTTLILNIAEVSFFLQNYSHLQVLTKSVHINMQLNLTFTTPPPGIYAWNGTSPSLKFDSNHVELRLTVFLAGFISPLLCYRMTQSNVLLLD